MSANQSVLEVLAQEGLPMTEKQLLRAVEEVPSLGTNIPGRLTPSDFTPLERLLWSSKEADGAVGVQTESTPYETNQRADQTERGQERQRAPWYGAILCRLGVHQGEWRYVAAGQCGQTLECGRCEVTKVRTRHQREWRYVGDRACEQVRICQQCSVVSGHRTRHEAWSKSWSAGRNTEAHRCNRCGVVETWDTGSEYM